MKRFARARWHLALVSGAALAALFAIPAGCTSEPPRAYAVRIDNRAQLIGGPRALGEVGDYKLSNGIIHAIIQNVGESRGFGAFGGSLIDVDLVRGGKGSSSTGAAGNDFFTEMFPAFFLEAIEPSKVEVLEDGGQGRAVVRVSGKGGEFLSLAKPINETVLPMPFEYTVDYILEPGKQYLKIVTTIRNPDPERTAFFPIRVPFGFITLMGEGQRLFVPGKAGFDMRHRLDEIYAEATANLEAFPGEVTPMIATEGQGVSYGVAASPRSAGYLNPEHFPGAPADSLLVPMASGSFLATFWGTPRNKELGPKQSYSYTGFLAVGTGDVASVQRVVYGIDDERRPTKTGRLSGRVREEGTGTALRDVSVVLEDASGGYVSAARTLGDGTWTADLPPGTYRAHAVDSVRSPTVSEPLVLEAGGSGRIDLALGRPAQLSVTVLGDDGRALPAKISVEAIHALEGSEPRSFLYDLEIGERMRPSDLDPDTEDPETRRYLEDSFFATHGTAGTAIRPGKYRVYASRGIEYDLASAEVELAAGQQRELLLVLRQVMPTPGWISADFHVHSIHSVDSDMPLPERVASYAVEGVDFLSSTDHNFVSDFAPTVEALKLQPWVKTIVGLELTTLEMGHFNAFPVVLEKGPVTHGSFGWFRRPPGTLFAKLRCPKGAPDPDCIGHPGGKTLVQVNHPRDSIMGYFSAFSVGSYSGEVIPNTSQFKLYPGEELPDGGYALPDGGTSPYDPRNYSEEFDLLEVFNGKHLEQVHHYRVPAEPPLGKDPTVPPCTADLATDCIPAAGEILEQGVARKLADGGTETIAQPAFPGALDDYYTLVGKKGKRFTAVGNSDSHGSSAEAGLPRTYVYVGATADGPMSSLSEDAVLDGLKAQRAVVTNGPFVEVKVNGASVGEEALAPDGTAEVEIVVRAAPWVDVSRVVVKRGGKDMGKTPQVLEEIPVPASKELVRLDAKRTYSGLPDDSFIVVEVSGDRSMWPVFTPYETPSILINDAVGAVGSAFGFGNKFGRYQPVRVRQVQPFAFTNPVRVVRTKKQPLEVKRRGLPLGPDGPFVPRQLPDLRRIFGSLHADE